MQSNLIANSHVDVSRRNAIPGIDSVAVSNSFLLAPMALGCDLEFASKVPTFININFQFPQSYIRRGLTWEFAMYSIIC